MLTPSVLQVVALGILFGPLVAAALTARPAHSVRETHYWIGTGAHAVAFGCAIVVLVIVAGSGQPPLQLALARSPWPFVPSFTLSIDRLAAVMMTLITAIGTLLYLFSIRYMQQERGRARYHTLLALAVGSLLFMVSSANLVTLFIFWQLLTWLLAILSFNYAHAPTVQGAFRTFIILRAGDVAFLSGIVLAYALYGTLELSELFVRAAAEQTTVSFFGVPGLTLSGSTAVTLLIFVGAMSKSAQFPLHIWLHDQLFAPTPVTALLHAGIINAGGFLLNRLAPLYGLSPSTLHVVFAIGTVTTLLGASMMLAQHDIKRTLGYSTIGQMGYMIMECGLGAFALAVFHLVAHGIFKTTYLLSSGNVIHAARLEPRQPHGHRADHHEEFFPPSWTTGFLISLVFPLVILLAAHGVLNVPLLDAHGMVIFLFFGWVTSSQAILTLYRLNALGSWKAASLMLATLVVVVCTYLFAAEAFTHFLYPEPGVVASYFSAAALPVPLFDALVLAIALAITLGWVVIYAKSHGRTLLVPGSLSDWGRSLRAHVYLLFMNRLYFDGLVLRVVSLFQRFAVRLDRSRMLPVLVLALAAALSLSAVGETSDWSIGSVARVLAAALLLPLFPVHTLYEAIVARRIDPARSTPAAALLPLVAAFALPALGLALLMGAMAVSPPALRIALSVLALSGALITSFRASVQERLPNMVAFTATALYGIVWWHAAVTGSVTSHAVVFTAAVAVVTTGLLGAWHVIRSRYGDIGLSQLGGLARPMPRFATVTALLVMAAAGLPPFGLFAGFVGMVVGPSFPLSGLRSLELTIVLLTWFAASWYLFKLMQRLLFGPYRPDLPYSDVQGKELTALALAVGLLVILGIAPFEWFTASGVGSGVHTVMKSIP